MNSTYKKIIYPIDESDIISTKLVIEVICYPLTEDKFYRLINSPQNITKITKYSKEIAFIGIGLLFKIVCVWGEIVYKAYNDPYTIKSTILKISNWEYFVVLSTFIISYLFHWYNKKTQKASDRDLIIQEIKDFFKKSKKYE